MTLIKSISGIRGTIGGKEGDNLTPPDIVRYTHAYFSLIRERKPGKKIHIAVGRDARLSGTMVQDLVTQTLVGLGADVFDLGLSTTPTVEVAVTGLKADGGIIITASHNPGQWNALKLLNDVGEFISAEEGQKVIDMAKEVDNINFSIVYIQIIWILKRNSSIGGYAIRINGASS